ncbi:MAG: hypothetical protein DMD43_05180 [Gemmatimonadetes bacterium]|nr:MAG: hypothetical protein DMD43_05180 [Gemmatimonadota bacterium]
MHPARHLTLPVLLALLLPSVLCAATTELFVDNDTNLFVPGPGTDDRDYTEGIRLNLFEDRPTLRGWETRLPGFARAPRLYSGYGLSQEIYTPDKISNPNLIRNDRPYVGWLYLSRMLIAEDAHVSRSLELKLGVIGPSSQADRVQTWWHSELGIRLPRGWKHQLADEPTVELRWQERWRPLGYRRYADFVPHVGAALGNSLTETQAGLTLRCGLRLPDDSGPWRNAPAAAARLGGRGFTAYVFARGEGRWVARNIVLDGNTFAPSPQVHRVPFGADAELGAEIGRGRFGLRYVFSYTTQEFRERYRTPEYGSIVLQF